MRKLFKNPLNNQKGAALMLALFCVTLITMIAIEIMNDSTVEFAVSVQELNSVKAKWAARAGIELSILRLFLYQKAAQDFGSMVPDKSIFDLIWQFPFAWPPQIPPGLAIADESDLQTTVKNSLMSGQYSTSIMPETSKIDINALGNPSEKLVEAVKAQILQAYYSERENNEDFQKATEGYDAETTLRNMIDWVTAGTDSKNGGDKRSYYNFVEGLPPQQPFRTINEIRVVAGMNDTFFNFLKSRVSIQGLPVININHATKEILMGLSPAITPERADQILKDRASENRGRFRDMTDFIAYLNSIGVAGDPFKADTALPLTFDDIFSFRIESSGRAGTVIKTITAVVSDVVKSQNFLTSKAQPDQASTAPKPTPDPVTGKVPSTSTSKEPEKAEVKKPVIIYWNES